MGVNDDYWMQQAYQLALQAKEKQEIPVGAVLVIQNEIVGKGYNQVISASNPCAHAEIIALQSAAQHIKNYRLCGSTLYVTLEPCIMCAGAIVHARVDRLVFASRDFKAGAAGSVFNLLKGLPLNHGVTIDEGMLQEECSDLLKDFFYTRRHSESV